MTQNEIRKADSKGRVSFGHPGQLFKVSRYMDGSIKLTPAAVYTRSELEGELGYTVSDELWDSLSSGGTNDN